MKTDYKAKIRLMMPFQGWCVSARGFHEHFSIWQYHLAKYAKRRYNTQRTKCFCPICDNELCGSNSHIRSSGIGDRIEETGFEFYKCSECKSESTWNFDYPVPLLVSYYSKGETIKVI